MLSRVANSLYWLSRYLERAENLARLAEVSRYGSLDAISNDERDRIWHPALATTCMEELFEKHRADGRPGLDAGEFIFLSPENPDSIRNCIANARENARMVRDQISEEMWLHLNRIHLFFQSREAADLWRIHPETLSQKVIRFCMLYEGLGDATILRDDSWRFIQIGKFLERADKTSRILDMLTYGEKPDRPRLTSVLRSCSGFVAFRKEFRGDITLSNVLSFMLFSQSFPRSVRFCIRQLDELLHELSGLPIGSFANEAERLTGSVLARLNFSNADDVDATGLHQYVDNLQAQMNEIGQQVFETYVLLPSEVQDTVPPEALKMQWEQQQQ